MGSTDWPTTARVPLGTLAAGDNTITITLPGDTGYSYDLVHLDRLTLGYPRAFEARDGALSFEAIGSVFEVHGLPTGEAVAYRLDAAGPGPLTGASVRQEGCRTYAARLPGTLQPDRFLVAAGVAARAPVFATGLTYDISDVISVYVSRLGLVEAQYSLTTAIGLVQSVLGFLMLFAANRLSGKLAGLGLW